MNDIVKANIKTIIGLELNKRIDKLKQFSCGSIYKSDFDNMVESIKEEIADQIEDFAEEFWDAY